MPEIRVWPVSSSERTWKVGSSSARRASAVPSFSWSAFVFGSIETAITGSGNSIVSSLIGAAGSQSVSPVEVCFRPTPGDDVAGEDLLALLAVVGVHLEDAADPLLAPGARVQDLRARALSVPE